ncbi:MAG: hypothetical protein HY554_18005 [Elusimicrobia bacterium]|nr:hypothetical protein [Elusimicrobiota bacterium]
MAFEGVLEGSYLSPRPAEALVSVPEVRAVEGLGLEGDRYFLRDGTYSEKHAPVFAPCLRPSLGLQMSRD